MTRPSTSRIIERLERLGRDLGFEATREASPGVPETYAPRTDLVWCGPGLADGARAEVERLARLAAVRSPLVGGRLPVAGFEVEGTDPSSKTMESDVANLLLLRYPIAALVVDSAPSGARCNAGDIHRRACRLRRTNALWCGLRPLAVVDASRLPEQAPRRAPGSSQASPRPRSTTNRGGSREDASRVRDQLVRRGRELGFHVECDAEPDLPRSIFAARQRALGGSGVAPDSECAVHLGLGGFELGESDRRAWTRAEQAFTAQRLDVVWSAPAPADLRGAHSLLAAADPDYGVLWPDPPAGPLLPVVAFEIDTGVAKHGGGSLLHLSRAAPLGALVVPDESVGDAAQLVAAYRLAMPLGPVAILGFGDTRRN